MNKGNDGKGVLRLAFFISVLAVFFPLYLVRENRVAEGVLYGLTGLPEKGCILFVLLPIFLHGIALFCPSCEARKKISIAFSFLGAISLILFLSGLSSYYGANGPESVRIAPGPGFLLMAFSLLVPVLGFEIPPGIASLGIGILVLVSWFLIATGRLDALGVLKEALNRQDRLVAEIVNHVRISSSAVLIASFLGIPAAFLISKGSKARKAFLGLMNVLQTIPSIALFGLLIAPLAALSRSFPLLREMGIRGIGDAPAIIALSIYALYPILRNTLAGIEGVSLSVLDSAEAMGMNRREMLRIIIIPLTLPFIVHGVRLAMIQSIANATLGKLIGAGGLGVFVFEGLGQYSVDMVVLGIIFLALLTIGADALFRIVGYAVVPKALRKQYYSEDRSS
jgi:osmoprotectant transport system permease protein